MATLLRTATCKTCPFIQDRDAVCRPDRRSEIARSVASDETFPCHSEVKYDDDGADTYGARQCAGVTTILLRSENANQVMRFAYRFGETPTEDDKVLYRSMVEWVGVEAVEGEPCNTVEEGCTAPAGWGGAGGVATNTETFAEHECYYCGEPVCGECATQTDDGIQCGFCRDF